MEFAKMRGGCELQRFSLAVQQGYWDRFRSQAEGSRIQHLAHNREPLRVRLLVNAQVNGYSIRLVYQLPGRGVVGANTRRERLGKAVEAQAGTRAVGRSCQ